MVFGSFVYGCIWGLFILGLKVNIWGLLGFIIEGYGLKMMIFLGDFNVDLYMDISRFIILENRRDELLLGFIRCFVVICLVYGRLV